MKNINSSCVIIPLYKTELSATEIISLKQSLDVFRGETFYFVVPKELNLSRFVTDYELTDENIVRFNDSFFKNIDGYNRLLMNPEFYQAFGSFDYMLICQLDVFVFSNQLTYWTQKGYDYIGAPWLDSEPTILRDLFRNLNKIYRHFLNKKQRSFEHLNLVGNGGFSLRNIRKHYSIALEQQELISKHIKNRPENNYYIEDVFWSIQVPKLYPDFKIPEYREALHFAIDRKPKRAFQLLQNKLPFACHGFNKPKVFNFWKSKIDALKNVKQ